MDFNAICGCFLVVFDLNEETAVQIFKRTYQIRVLLEKTLMSHGYTVYGFFSESVRYLRNLCYEHLIQVDRNCMHDLRFPSDWRGYSAFLKFVCKHAHASPPAMTSWLINLISKEHSTHVKLSGSERLTSIEHTVANILGF